MNRYRTIKVSKLSASRRQLDCAIEMWFAGKDEVSVHTLAGAAHQIIYDINQKRGGGDVELLFNSEKIKDEYRDDWRNRIKREMNFFKHADKDPDPGSVTELWTMTTVMFFLFSLVGLKHLGERLNNTEETFLLWVQVYHPEWFEDDHQQKLVQLTATGALGSLRDLDHKAFFETGLQIAAIKRAR